jgi:metal-responsive CopG/Arc/MetJ family transcriptional regulator
MEHLRVMLTAYIRPELAEEIKRVSQEEDLPRSRVVERALRHYLLRPSELPTATRDTE